MDPQFRSRETPHDAPPEPVLPGPEPVPGGGRAPFDDRQHLVVPCSRTSLSAALMSLGCGLTWSPRDSRKASVTRTASGLASSSGIFRGAPSLEGKGDGLSGTGLSVTCDRSESSPVTGLESFPVS